MKLRFHKATNRNTQAYVISIGSAAFCISYETVVAVSGEIDDKYIQARLDNTWGPTTGRHMNEMGVRDYPVLDTEAFEELCDRLLHSQALEAIKERLER